jgi:hypothetical protein
MTQPQIITADDLHRTTVLAEYRKGRWTPSRPISYFFSWPRSLINRLRLARQVFTGRYDALDWEDVPAS